MPSRSRDDTFVNMCVLARQGMTRRQIAEHYGTTYNALECYMRRQGITMAELKGEDDGPHLYDVR